MAQHAPDQEIAEVPPEILVALLVEADRLRKEDGVGPDQLLHRLVPYCRDALELTPAEGMVACARFLLTVDFVGKEGIEPRLKEFGLLPDFDPVAGTATYHRYLIAAMATVPAQLVDNGSRFDYDLDAPFRAFSALLEAERQLAEAEGAESQR